MIRPIQFETPNGINLFKLKEQIDRRVQLIAFMVKGANHQQNYMPVVNSSMDNYCQTDHMNFPLQQIKDTQKRFFQSVKIVKSPQIQKRDRNNLDKQNCIQSSRDPFEKKMLKSLNFTKTDTKPNQIRQSIEISQDFLSLRKRKGSFEISSSVNRKSVNMSICGLYENSQNQRLIISEKVKNKMQSEIQQKLLQKNRKKQPKINNVRGSLLRRLDEKHKKCVNDKIK